MPESILDAQVYLSKIFLWIIPGAPLASAVVLAAFGTKWIKEKSHLVCATALAISFILSLGLLIAGPMSERPIIAAAESAETPAHAAARPVVWQVIASGYEWMRVGDLTVRMDLRSDAMTAIMLVTVTLVSFLVCLFAAGYMHHDPGYARFFAEVSLFVFSMCMLVLAGNFLVLFVFWEAVGLCSYLLIGFWFRKPSAAAAARKAFLVNRIGDFGFLTGIFFIWRTFGTVSFDAVLGDPGLIAKVAAQQPGMITLICLLLFVGAAGKSAQFPLHVWLPDAMEGPTPVSALIHAATMVTAGVYMVARCTPLFMHAPQAQVVVSVIGGGTALLAALIALTQTDLKRVMAYSTVSQLGYMFLALGAGVLGGAGTAMAVGAAMFHLFTHAFFKALLFLASGSVMHSMGNVIDMRRFSGLKRVMPITHKTFLVGALALAGVPVLSGFWSKDDIIAVVSEASHEGAHRTTFLWLYGVSLLTAVLTAFYTFRAYFLTFHGPEKFPEEAGHHPHESPPIMAWPLIILAVFAAAIGLIVGPTGLFSHYLSHTEGIPEAGPHHFHWGVMAMSTVAALLGIGVAWFMYKSPRPAEQASKSKNPFYGLSQNRFYLDELFTGLIVWPLELLAKACVVFDLSILDRFVDAIGELPPKIGQKFRPLQDGLVQSYALLMLIGLTFFLLVILR